MRVFQNYQETNSMDTELPGYPCYYVSLVLFHCESTIPFKLCAPDDFLSDTGPNDYSSVDARKVKSALWQGCWTIGISMCLKTCSN